MRVLALDLATKTGFAFGTVADGVIEHGVNHLPKTGEDVGLYLIHHRDWLDQLIVRLKPDEVIFESPILFTKKTTLSTLRKLYGLAGVTEMVAFEAGVKCLEENVETITTHFLGKGAGVPRHGDARKEATVKKCRERGWLPKNDNDADALALLDLAFALKNPHHALAATPLFGAGGARP